MIVRNGDIRGIRYWICKNKHEGMKGEGYWVVYVDMSSIMKSNGSPIESDEDVDDFIDVHEGCTFFGKAEDLPEPNRPDDVPGDAAVAGWDYMHGYDMAFPYELMSLSSKQTLNEVAGDVRSAIEKFLKFS